jgi:hypothetical protein
MRLRNDVIKINKDIVILRLTQGQQTIIDRDDYEKIMDYPWTAAYCKETKSYRAISRDLSGKVVRMHRVLLNVNDNKLYVDHIKHDTLDNRKCNLRICTHAENNMNRSIQHNNTSGYKGVCFNKRASKYQVSIWVKNNINYLGLFENKIDAAKAYDDAAIKYYGEFAKLNFPKENSEA